MTSVMDTYITAAATIWGSMTSVVWHGCSLQCTVWHPVENDA